MKRFSLSRWLSGKKPSKSRRKRWSGGAEVLETRVVPALAQIGSVDVAPNFPIVNFNGKAFFFAQDSANDGYEPWISDGTAAGTFQISDLNPGAASSVPNLEPGDPVDNIYTLAAVVGNQLYFAANNGLLGTELWVTDGTAAGTRLVSNIYTETSSSTINSSYPRNLINVNGTLFFSAISRNNGRELWQSNGTAGGTRMVVDLTPGFTGGLTVTNYVGSWASIGDTLIFTGANYVTNSFGNEPYAYNQATATLTLLKDIYPGSLSSFPLNYHSYRTPAGVDLVAFGANNNSTGGELWFTDGTPGGTFLARDINLGSTGSLLGNFTSNFNYDEFTTVGDKFFFRADDGNVGRELWLSDGTTSGTNLVVDAATGVFTSDPTYLADVNGTLFFASRGNTFTNTLYKSDGTAANTTVVTSGLSGVQIQSPRDIVAIRDFAVFAVDRTTGAVDRSRELWVSDGTTGNTQPANTARNTSLLDPQGLVAIGNTAFMTVAGLSGQRYLARYRLSEPPTDMFLTPTTVPEESPIGTEVGVLTTDDPDLPNDSFTYSLVTGAGSQDNALFKIVGDRVQVNARLDFEARTSYSIRVGVIDRGGNAIDRVFTITLSDINESPTDIVLNPGTVVEAQPVGTLVGNFGPVDADRLSQTFVYSLVAGPGDTDNALFDIPVPGNPGNLPNNQLRTNSVFDFEARSSYSIRVRVINDDVGNPATLPVVFEKVFTIQVTNTNETPTDLQLTGNTVLENQPDGTVVGILSGVDPDAGDTLIFSVQPNSSAPDSSQFRVVGNQLVTNEELDFEAGPIRLVNVRGEDGGGLAFERVFQVNVLNLNELQTTILLSNTEVDENSPGGTSVGTLTTPDAAYAATLTWTLSDGIGGEDNAAFQIVGNTLAVSSTAALDFESKNRYAIRVKATDSTNLAFEKRFVIIIRDVNEAPGPLTLTRNVIPEAQPVGTPVGFLRAPDPEANDTVTFSLVPGVGSQDNSLFSIFETTLRADVEFDFDVRRFYSVRVRASDQHGNNVEQTFEIQVTQAPKVTPLYRLFSEALNYHFFTSNRAEYENAIRIGYRDETRQLPGVQVLERQLAGALPLYRMYNLQSRRHYYTTSIEEGRFLEGLVKPGQPGYGTSLGWRIEKIEGFIYDTPQPNTVEVFRLYNISSGTHLFTESVAVRDAVLRSFPNEWFLHNRLGYAYQGVMPSASATAQFAAAVPSAQPAVVEASLPAATVADFNRLDSLVALPTILPAASSAPVSAAASSETDTGTLASGTEGDSDSSSLDAAFTCDLGDLLG